MFDKDTYKAAFDKVTASEETYRKVMHMTNERKSKSGRSIGTRLLVAAAIIAMLAITAYAAEETITPGMWFYDFFADREGENAAEIITDNQRELIADGLVNVNQSVTCDGYTITLESAITDGYKAYLKFVIEAPEGTVLDGDRYGFGDYPQIFMDTGEKTDENDESISAGTCSMKTLDDGDPTDNKASLLMEMELSTAKSSDYSYFSKAEYSFELNAIVEYRRLEEDSIDETIAEGSWEFTFSYGDRGFMGAETEILAEPIKCTGERMFRDYKFDVTVKVTSFRLRALTAELIYEKPLTGYWEGIDLDDGPYVVMKDGSKIEAHFSMGTYMGEEWKNLYDFPVPVSIEDVDYVEFPGGAMVYVEQEES